MPKANITFNLPEEEVEFETCMAADKLKQALQDIVGLYRTERKHGGEKVTEKMVWDILTEYGIDLWDE